MILVVLQLGPCLSFKGHDPCCPGDEFAQCRIQSHVPKLDVLLLYGVNDLATSFRIWTRILFYDCPEGKQSSEDRK